jgi:hypothetical protein
MEQLHLVEAREGGGGSMIFIYVINYNLSIPFCLTYSMSLRRGTNAVPFYMPCTYPFVSSTFSPLMLYSGISNSIEANCALNFII